MNGDFERMSVGLAVLIAAVLVSGVACTTIDHSAEFDEHFEEVDNDDDGIIDEHEFAENVAIFEQMDIDGDGFVEPEEFDEEFPDELRGDVSNFGYYDEDDDGVLVEKEFDVGLFEDLDADGDGDIERDEWGFE
ncbi:MAG: hypothetical protein ABEN55_19485 [Bradymonadaceae bacterium]